MADPVDALVEAASLLGVASGAVGAWVPVLGAAVGAAVVGAVDVGAAVVDAPADVVADVAVDVAAAVDGPLTAVLPLGWLPACGNVGAGGGALAPVVVEAVPVEVGARGAVDGEVVAPVVRPPARALPAAVVGEPVVLLVIEPELVEELVPVRFPFTVVARRPEVFSSTD